MKYILEKTDKIPETRFRMRDPELDVVWENIIKNVDTQTWLKLSGFVDRKEIDRVYNSLKKKSIENGDILEIHERNRIRSVPQIREIYIKRKGGINAV